ncbi:hypothetical protein CKM354_000289200 [Cercospora kikuchii]|uniref:Uncharacterized protein n=1 Tax=Cercospora kikuchii TaxID=84275 RepID=A0A9P3FEG7_9PEZI|nr:uncharacterized protein CKM354_000289200 [Cercospora kikuchii]GIZ39510.1 hypothetical protein CKM354_000289200 [Cercospora kikuchii]
MAPFLAETVVHIPQKDILSWYFDSPRFDQNRQIYVYAADATKFWTAEQCRKVIRQLAAGFQHIGLQAQETVCIHAFNSINYPVLVNGIVAAGGVFTGSNPAYTLHELIHHLRTSKTKFVIVEPELLPTFLEAAEHVSVDRDRIFAFSETSYNDVRSWTELRKHGEKDWPRFNDQRTARATLAALLFSSGTTGLPKAAMLSHYNFVAQCTVLGDMKGVGWQKRRLIALPMFHASTVPSVHFNPLYTGDTMYIARRFELESFMRDTEGYGVTDISLVPPIINRILSSPFRHKYSLKGIRNAQSGAAPLDPATQARFKELLPESTPLTQVWGMTETVATCCMTPYTDGHEITGSVGKMAPNIDIKLCDDDGNDITANNVRGEICIRGPVVIAGYFHNGEANKRDWDSDGFFHTGDIAYRDGETKLWYIVDRKKELIKVRGFQVAPSEIEGVLVSHPDISDAGVIGVLHNGEEQPRAYVVSATKDRSGIESYLAEKLAKYKQCTGGIVFVDEIPKTASGKILRRTLREWASKKGPGSKL